jgi:hypothetical protein
MIQAAVLLRTFYGYHVAYVLYYTHLLVVAAGVHAYDTHIGIGYVVAVLAEFYAMAHAAECTGKFIHLTFILAQQVQHHA